MRALGLEGLNVTMPHKAAVLEGLDSLTEAAADLGAVNCITRRGQELVGDSTDGPGLIAALRLDEGIDVAGRRAPNWWCFVTCPGPWPGSVISRCFWFMRCVSRDRR